MSRTASSVVLGIAIAFAAAGCAGGTAADGIGGAGSGATGGAAAGTGGRAGVGGAASGIGGGVAGSSGGSGGSAGTSGSGGRPGTGGTIGAGGSPGTGGIAGTGGTAGRAGTGGGAGGSGAGGMGTGGRPGMGGCTGTTLKAAATCTGRLFGAALASAHLTETAYATAAREHNFASPENEMKWDQIEPTRGNYTFGPADQIVTFAMQNGMKMKGHTLVWHKQLPAYVTNLTTAADVRSAMLEHINGVVSHFKGKIAAWDVVNEAWLTDGKTGNGNPRIRDSVFSTALGPSFIDEAFMAASQADSGALLIYNEFAAEGLSDKANSVYNMIKDMKMRGIPIDGVGLQMHIGYNTALTPAELAQNMQRFADIGVKVFISEMDVNGCAGYSPDQQKTQYHDVVATCVAQPACSAVTVWGITDKYTWEDIAVNPNSAAGCATGQLPVPLLWDLNFAKKPTYTGAMDALLGR